MQTPQHAGRIIGTVWCVRMIGGVIGLALIMLALPYLRPQDTVSQVVVCIIASRIMFDTTQIFSDWFESQTRLPVVTRWNIAAVGVAFLVKVFVVVLDGGMIGLALAYALEWLLMAVARGACFARERHNAGRLSFDGALAKTLLRASWPLWLSSFGALANLHIDQVMIGQMLGDAEVGIYAVAARLSEVIYFLPVAIMTAVFPTLLHKRDEGDEVYRAYVQQLLDIMCMLALAFAVSMQFIAPIAIPLVFGVAFTPSVAVFLVHVWAGVFVFLRCVMTKWLLAENFMHYVMWTQLLGAAVNVALNYWWIPQYGVLGSAYATVLSYAVSGYVALFFIRKTRALAWMMTASVIAPYRYAKNRYMRRNDR